MKRTSLSIDRLVEMIDRSEVRLPEIQRGYVWRPAQVAGLVDSLYRGYPSGSLLLWQTEAPVEEREAAISGPSEKPLVQPQYLLDGQQRLTSLHRVFTNHQSAQVVFNVESQRFQIESAATNKDPRWVRVFDVLFGGEGVFALVNRLREKIPQIDPDEIGRRIESVKRIADYAYHIEIIEGLGYEEVTDIFVRVNSKGKALKAVDLALATLSARWPGVIDKLDDERKRWKQAGYRDIDFPFLTRSLAALGTESATLSGFTSASVGDLEVGWRRTQAGIGHLVTLLKSNAGIVTSDLIPSMNALVPLVVFLGLRDEGAMTKEDVDGLIYWLFGAFLLQRFSAAAETVIAQDTAAIKSGAGIAGLFKNLGIMGERLQVTEENLVGRGVKSPYFLLSYLAARRAGATDWWYGAEISPTGEGGFAIEYHHIHPRATLRKDYSKAEINDMANLAFISAKANRKIGSRSPVKYFPELLDSDREGLSSHFVPEDPDLRDASRYRDFVRARRRQLASAMTDLLDSYRPSNVSEGAPAAEDPTSGDQLTLSVVTDTHDPMDGILVLSAARDGSIWQGVVPMSEFDQILADLENGLASQIELAGEATTFSADAESVEIPIGPLLVTGSIEEWRMVMEREYVEAVIVDQLPSVESSAAWSGDRTHFSVVASE